jgi:putative MATE family efflux protein
MTTTEQDTAREHSSEHNSEQRQSSRNEERVNRLGTGKVSKLMLEFAIPSIIGLVVNGLYNIIDSIFLGHGVGLVGQATASVAMPVMIVGMAVAMLIGNGGNALVALRLGEGKLKEAEKVMGTTFIMTIVAGVVVTAIILLFMDPVLMISGATELTRDSAHKFLTIISFGLIVLFLGMGFNNFIRTAGDPNRALYTMVAGTLVCIALNYLFVMVLGWGVEGSAWATVIGQAVSAVLVMWFFTVSKKAPFKLRIANLKPKLRMVFNILALGSASFALQISAAVLAFVLNNLLKDYGAMDPITADGAIAAINVVQRVAMFAFFPIMGVAIAAQPLFGFNYGAQYFARVKITFRLAFIWVMVIGVFFWLLVHIFPEQIIGIFGIEPGLVAFTVDALKVQMMLMPVVGLQVVSANYFQSTGQPGRSMLLSLTRQLLYLLPLMYLMPQFLPLLIEGVTPLQSLYYTYPVADFLSIFTAAVLMVFEFKKLNKKISEAKGNFVEKQATELPA